MEGVRGGMGTKSPVGNTSSMAMGGLCRFFAAGGCAYGARCRYAHAAPPTVPAQTTTDAFKVVCWNVLAHIHTHYNANGHGGAVKTTESAEQRLLRHQRIARTLLDLQADAYLLQEVDSHFMPADWQPDRPLPCGEMLRGYTPYRSYSKRGEGTVVMLRDDRFVRDTSIRTAYLPATAEHGWKTGVVLHAQPVGGGPHFRWARLTARASLRRRLRAGTICTNTRANARRHATGPRIAFVSVHLRWGEPAAQSQLLSSALSAVSRATAVVLAGDFNSTPLELDESVPAARDCRAPSPLSVRPCCCRCAASRSGLARIPG
jgi:endonuclease/exonuclease/phosphatase family metal-dependent hydrolase